MSHGDQWTHTHGIPLCIQVTLVIRAFAIRVFVYPRLISVSWGVSIAYPRQNFKMSKLLQAYQGMRCRWQILAPVRHQNGDCYTFPVLRVFSKRGDWQETQPPCITSETSCSHGSEYEDDCLLGFCAVQFGRSLPTFQRCLLSIIALKMKSHTFSRLNYMKLISSQAPEVRTVAILVLLMIGN
jgi:hypothetical protein